MSLIYSALKPILRKLTAKKASMTRVDFIRQAEKVQKRAYRFPDITGYDKQDFLIEAGISQILQRASYPAEGFRGDSKISCDVFLRDSSGQIREYFSEVNVSFGGVLDQKAVFSVKFIPDSLFKEYDPQILESIIVADQFSDLGCLTYHNS